MTDLYQWNTPTHIVASNNTYSSIPPYDNGGIIINGTSIDNMSMDPMEVPGYKDLSIELEQAYETIEDLLDQIEELKLEIENRAHE